MKNKLIEDLEEIEKIRANKTTYHDKCIRCGGTGISIDTYPAFDCEVCNGTGRIQKD